MKNHVKRFDDFKVCPHDTKYQEGKRSTKFHPFLSMNDVVVVTRLTQMVNSLVRLSFVQEQELIIH